MPAQLNRVACQRSQVDRNLGHRANRAVAVSALASDGIAETAADRAGKATRREVRVGHHRPGRAVG